MGAAQERAAWWRQGDRLERAKNLWENHPEITAEKIGQQLGCSKSAVIGIAYRQGFGSRGAYRQGFGSHGKSPSLDREPTLDPFADLSPSACRWPIGHVGERGFHFCGGQAREGRPYCEEHCAVAYVALKGRDAAD